MREQGDGGSIVNITSIDAIHPSGSGLSHYGTSKHAIWGLTKTMALELGPDGIRVNAVAPGPSLTEGAVEFVEAGAPEGIDVDAQWAAYEARIPLRRLAHPDDVARARSSSPPTSARTSTAPSSSSTADCSRHDDGPSRSPSSSARLPMVDSPLASLRGWMLQNDRALAMFYEIPDGVEVPEHAHGAQWGVVLEGTVEFTIGGETRTYGPGETYYVPDVGRRTAP